MYCNNCGERIQNHSNFCPKCGCKTVTVTYIKRNDNWGWNRKRIIPVVFALVSLLLMMTNWLTLTGNTQYYMAQLQFELSLVLKEVEALLDQIGMNINIRPAYDIITKISDESLNPFEMFSIASDGISVLSDIKPYSVIITQITGEDLTMLVNILLGICYIYIVLLVMSIVSGIVTLLARIFDTKRKINRLFFLSHLLLLIYLGVLCCLGSGDNATLPIRPTITAAISVILTCFTGPQKKQNDTVKTKDLTDISNESYE